MKSLFLAVALFLLVIGGAQGKSKKESKDSSPLWLTSEGLEVLYPKDVYLAQVGFSDSAEGSKAAAAGNIATYISARVESKKSATSQLKSVAGETVSTERLLISDNTVTSDERLYKVEWTVPYYDKKKKRYYCLAYINREDAFLFLRPRLESARDNFQKRFSEAMDFPSSYEKINGLNDAKLLLKDFHEVKNFLMAVAPNQLKAYESLDELENLCNSTIATLKKDLLIYITSDKKGAEALEGVVRDALEKKGFIPTSDTSAPYKAGVFLFGSKGSKEGDIIISYPTVRFTLTSGDRVLFSYEKELGKVAGYSESRVKRDMIKKAAEIISSIADFK